VGMTWETPASRFKEDKTAMKQNYSGFDVLSVDGMLDWQREVIDKEQGKETCGARSIQADPRVQTNLETLAGTQDSNLKREREIHLVLKSRI
jgi:hypothetical protein